MLGKKSILNEKKVKEIMIIVSEAIRKISRGAATSEARLLDRPAVRVVFGNLRRAVKGTSTPLSVGWVRLAGAFGTSIIRHERASLLPNSRMM